MSWTSMWQALKGYVGYVLIALAAIGLIVLLVFLFRELAIIVGSNIPTESALPLLAIGGLIALVMVLTVVAMVFWFLGLTDQRQAMGLPEGSIRAVIALSLIVLFAILAVFLYQRVSEGGRLHVIMNLSDAERVAFIKDHPSARDLDSYVSTDKSGQPVKAADGSALYSISYRSPSLPVGDDFAKQLLVLLGTLMTAITSFYLGANTATSAAAAVAQPGGSTPAPVLTGINPVQHRIADDGPVVPLQIAGTNLNSITRVKIVRAGIQIQGTNVSSNATRVTCNIPVSSATTPAGPAWDVVVEDGGSITANLPGALTIVP